jgi:hypothetical protein
MSLPYLAVINIFITKGLFTSKSPFMRTMLSSAKCPSINLYPTDKQFSLLIYKYIPQDNREQDDWGGQ